jgi:hypothetical protein
MKSKTTGIWFVLAASLFAFIWLYQKYLQPAPAVIENLLPGLHAADLTRIQVNPAGQREICVVRAKGGWQMQKPLAYPALSAAVEALATTLEKLTPATRLTAAELGAKQNAETEFGFDNPQFTLLLENGGQRRQLLVGSRTAPGDQVFLRVVGTDGAFVTDAAWLALVPHHGTNWRDTALVEASGACDWIVVTNGPKVMEFRRDATNQLWRMTRPLQARADATRIAAALQQLRNGRVAQFVTDDPRADLSGYALQPAELAVWLGRGTNLFSGVSAGKTSPDKPAQIFARREGWNAVVATAKDTFAPWRAAVNDWRDPRLLTLTAPVAEIEVRGEQPYTLQQSSSNTWAVAGETFAADIESIQNFLKLLAGLRVSEYVKDVVTPADLQGFGLTTPARQITLRSQTGGTNGVLARLLFGNMDTNRVFVKRGDEDFVYALKIEDLARLPEHGWEFRDRRLWHFSETNITQVTLRQNGKTRVLVRTGTDKWSLGPNSQGIINPPAIEETFHRLGELTAAGWVGRHIAAPEKYGLNPDNLAVTIELASGEKLGLEFGAELGQGQTALAATTLDGERWVFVFPPPLYQFVTAYLTIPPNTP